MNQRLVFVHFGEPDYGLVSGRHIRLPKDNLFLENQAQFSFYLFITRLIGAFHFKYFSGRSDENCKKKDLGKL